MPTLKALGRRGGNLAVAGLVGLLRVYRATLSFAFGPCCRFHPSCSAYAEQALRAHGAVRGSGLAAWRLLRCHPLSAGGLDPVPPGRSRVETVEPMVQAAAQPPVGG